MSHLHDKQIDLLKIHLFNGDYQEFNQLAEKIKQAKKDPQGEDILAAIRGDDFGWLSFRVNNTDKKFQEKELYDRQKNLLGILGVKQQVKLISLTTLFDTNDIDIALLKLLKEIPQGRDSWVAINDTTHLFNNGLTYLAQELLFKQDWTGFDYLCQVAHHYLSLKTPANGFYFFYDEPGVRGSFLTQNTTGIARDLPLYYAGGLTGRDERFFQEMKARGVKDEELTEMQDEMEENFKASYPSLSSQAKLDTQLFKVKTVLTKMALKEALQKPKNSKQTSKKLDPRL